MRTVNPERGPRESTPRVGGGYRAVAVVDDGDSDVGFAETFATDSDGTFG